MKNDGASLWKQMEEVHQTFRRLVGELKALDKTERLELIRKGYKNRPLTVDVLEYFAPDDLEELLPFLLSHARSVHPALGRIRQLILSLPKEWLVDHIEETAEPFLQNGGDEDYRRFLELYIKLDPELTKRLAQRALASPDPDIREAGQDFLEKLST